MILQLSLHELHIFFNIQIVYCSHWLISEVIILACIRCNGVMAECHSKVVGNSASYPDGAQVCTWLVDHMYLLFHSFY